MPTSLVSLAQLELDGRENGNDNGKNHTHSVGIAIAIELKAGVVDVVHNGVSAVVGELRKLFAGV